MKLEPKHILPYLPDLKVKTSDGIFNVLGWEYMYGIMLDTTIYGVGAVPGYQLLLHPLSDLTKEIEHNGERFVPIDKLNEHDGFNHLSTESPESIYGLIMNVENSAEVNLLAYPLDHIQTLFELQFDVFSLIDQNLAIDINTIEK